MRVLVTGATGFIGTHVTRELCDRGCEVFALVLPEETGKLEPRAKPLAGDLFAAADVEEAISVARPEMVVHLAWYANPVDYLHSSENVRHLAATLRLAERVLAFGGCGRFLGVGTCLEYDTRRPGPLEEGATGDARFLYAVCKGALFDVLSWMLKGKIGFAWARLFWLYGPGERPIRLVPAVARALLRGETARVTSGEQVRDFLHVADVATGIASLAQSSLEGPVNIASGVPVTVREVVAALARLSGREDLVAYGAIAPRAGDPASVYADVSRVRSIGWAPRYDLEAGLRETLAWWSNELERAERLSTHA